MTSILAFLLSFNYPKTILNSGCQFQTQHFSFPSLLQMHITSSFQLRFVHHLKRWTFDFSSFKTISSFPKIDLKKCSKLYLKVRVNVTAKFWVPKFHVNLITFASNLLHYGCLPSISIHNILLVFHVYGLLFTPFLGLFMAHKSQVS